jgi:hypothetical protein
VVPCRAHIRSLTSSRGVRGVRPSTL